MASSLHLFLISLTFFCYHLSHGAENKPRAIILPVRKDVATLQYYTSIEMGTPPVSIDAVIDIGAQFLWFNCEDGYNSTSYLPVRCGSTKCETAKGFACVGCNLPRRPGCTNNTCGISPYNPIANLLAMEGLGEDVLAVYSTDGATYLDHVAVPRFLFSCASSFLLEGLANGTKGILGLGRTQIAMQMQLASAFNFPHKFALCLPSSTESGPGDIFIGSGPYYRLPYTKDISKSLITTPLIINPVSTAAIYTVGDPSDEYFIEVKSIKVGGKSVNFNASLLTIDENGVGGTKISTVTPHTILHTSIYEALIEDYVNKAAPWKMTRVASVAPFGACFSSKTTATGNTGPVVPTIDLVLQSKSVCWRIYGANSMVKVEEDVLCLGFVDGGAKPRTSIVIGGHQLEDNFLEFDLASSKLGLSSTLLLRNTSCSRDRLL